MGVYQVIPYLWVLADLLNVVFVIRRYSNLNFVLTERFRHCFLQHKSKITGMGHCSQSIYIYCEQTLRLTK